MRGVTLALRWTARVLFALLCVAVAAYAFAYLFRDHPPGNRFHQQFMASGWDVPMHFFGGGVALLLALRVPAVRKISAGVRERAKQAVPLGRRSSPVAPEPRD